MLKFQIFISAISGTQVVTILLVLISTLLLLLGYKKDFYRIFFAMTLAATITFLLKQLFKIPRPENMLIIEDGFRFPSGHATMAGVVSTIVFVYAYKHIKNKKLRYFVYIFSFVWLVLVSYSRIYLHVHYLIDVIVGGLVGVLSTLIIMKIYRHFNYYN